MNTITSIQMSTEIRNVTLSFPCREDWDKFDVVPGGRLCQSCKFVVRDFRDCTMTELDLALRSGQRVCGRFRKKQLSESFLKAAVVTLGLTVPVACLEQDPVPTSNPDQWEELMGDIVTTGIVVAVDSIVITEPQQIASLNKEE